VTVKSKEENYKTFVPITSKNSASGLEITAKIRTLMSEYYRKGEGSAGVYIPAKIRAVQTEYSANARAAREPLLPER
jgi:hypothetical protein